MFNVTIIMSINVRYLLIKICGLYVFISCVTISVPPVDELTFNIIAVPIPIITPPYIQAKNLSFVIGGYLSNISINKDRLTVPIKDFTKNSFPILYPANMKSGILVQ